MCAKHKDVPSTYYCFNCAMTICSKCKSNDKSHVGHTFDFITDFSKRILSEFKSFIDQIGTIKNLLKEKGKKIELP